MANASVLPVGVVVPTLNAMTYLARHVERLRELAPSVEEIVVVDSHSADGTAEYLREHLSLPKVRHLSHPPGLYASWNFGLSQLRAKYAYIATVGDTVPLATLEQLVALAEEREADVVLTPPKFVTESGRISGRRWPIHDFIEKHRLNATTEIPGWKAFAWTALNVPAGLLGSSASNLYRTDVLQRHLFPTGFGHHGDTAWLLENALGLRIVLAPQIASEFFLHESANRTRVGGDTPRRVLLSRLARATWRGATGSSSLTGAPRACAITLEEFWEQMEQWFTSQQRHEQLRAASAVWWMNPRAWQARAERSRAMSNVKQSARDGLDRLAGMAGSD